VCSLLIAWSSPAIAQEQGGSIQGIVKDASGAVLPGVTVEARSPSVVGVSTTTTDSRGEYRFPALPSGVYEITAALQGFTTKKIPDVQLQLGQILKLDVPLQRRAAAHLLRREEPVPRHDDQRRGDHRLLGRHAQRARDDGRDDPSRTVDRSDRSVEREEREQSHQRLCALDNVRDRAGLKRMDRPQQGDAQRQRCQTGV